MHFSLSSKYIPFFVSRQIGTVWRFVYKDIRPLFSCYMIMKHHFLSASLIMALLDVMYLKKHIRIHLNINVIFKNNMLSKNTDAYGCSKYPRLIQLFIHIVNFTSILWACKLFAANFPYFYFVFFLFFTLVQFFPIFYFFLPFFRKLNFNPHSHLFSAIDILDGYEI